MAQEPQCVVQATDNKIRLLQHATVFCDELPSYLTPITGD